MEPIRLKPEATYEFVHNPRAMSKRKVRTVARARNPIGRAVRLAAVAVGVVALAGAAAWWTFRPARPLHPNLLLVTIDTLRADHVGAYGATTGATPTIDALAPEGVR